MSIDDTAKRTIVLTVISGFALVASFFRWLPDGVPDPAWIAIAFCGAPILYGAISGSDLKDRHPRI